MITSEKQMTQIEAVRRLRFTIGNQYKSNATDVEALNVLLKSIENSQQKTVEDNRVFAKILCMYITWRYEVGSNDMNSVLKFLNNELKNPLELHIDKLSNKMRVSQLKNFINTLTIELTDDEQKDIESLTESENKFWTANQKEIMEEIRFLNSADNIRNHFYSTANQILQEPNFRS